MRSVLIFAVLAGLLLPAFAQDEPETPLGDVARALRKAKKVPEPNAPVIDNDNFSKVMDDAESRKAKGAVKLTFAGSGRDIQVSSPDVTCNLSFNGDGATLTTDSSSPLDLPSAELVKLDGPASINGDTLQVSVYNATNWRVDEITIGLTILRPPASNAANYGNARVLPAAAVSDAGSAKRSDLTVLYHLRGSASPFSTALFKQAIGITLGADQEWHWAIVQARGIPPK
jgi:hypothetical protein